MEDGMQPFPVRLAAVEAYELRTGFVGFGEYLVRNGHIRIIEATNEQPKNRQAPLINSESWRTPNEGGDNLFVSTSENFKICQPEG